MKMFSYSICFLMVLLTTSVFAKVEKEAAKGKDLERLVMVIGENMSEPYLIKDEKNPNEPKGIQPEYMRALAKHLKRKPEILVLPKFRIIKYIEDEEIDMNCYTTPQWAKVGKTKIRWSEPLFVLRDMIFSQNDLSSKTINDLFGSTIGATLYYRYMSTEKHFADGKLKREDAPTEKQNILKLEANRINYAILPEIPLYYHLKTTKPSKINPKGIVIEETPIRCWIKDSVKISTDELNKAIDDMKKSGELDKIFKKYR